VIEQEPTALFTFRKLQSGSAEVVNLGPTCQPELPDTQPDHAMARPSRSWMTNWTTQRMSNVSRCDAFLRPVPVCGTHDEATGWPKNSKPLPNYHMSQEVRAILCSPGSGMCSPKMEKKSLKCFSPDVEF